jgi:hypothetical protein
MMRSKLMEVRNLGCCGLQEIDGVSNYNNAENALMGFLQDVGGADGVRSGVIFTSAGRSKTRPLVYALNLKEYIESHRLGTVHTLPSFRNKNSGNQVITFLWIVKPTNLARWWRAY